MKKIIKKWISQVLLTIILAILINKFLIYTVYITSESMSPTINKDDRLFIRKIYNSNSIKRGDILVFNSEELREILIKRVIGLPGDNIKIHNGEITINGEKIEEEYVKNNEFNYEGEFIIPSGKYFFLGDNRNNSKDSRFWVNPYIDFEDIEGKVLIRVYPFKAFGKL